MMRLTAAFWVQAYLRRLTLENIPAYILAHGDDTAGAVLVKLATLDGDVSAVTVKLYGTRGQRPDRWALSVKLINGN